MLRSLPSLVREDGGTNSTDLLIASGYALARVRGMKAGPAKITIVLASHQPHSDWEDQVAVSDLVTRLKTVMKGMATLNRGGRFASLFNCTNLAAGADVFNHVDPVRSCPGLRYR